ncbi:MAG: sugar ABC transporter ATP-binding protein [Anaerolineales bacterium]|nr:sugar ABC transporter ATP-binding protein [Anaerolineales bacterium]
MGNSDFLEMRGICKSFDGTQALQHVNFSAAAGEVHAISGENGAGKSTLVKILSGALQSAAGEILLDGKLIELGTPLRARRLGIYAVYQEFSLISHLTIAENILLGQMPSTRVPGVVNWTKAFHRAEEILKSIGFVGIDVRKTVRELSVSHQQMVEIAKAVADQRRILILDEPSAVLSQEELNRLFALVRQLKLEGTLVLYISHRLDEVFEIADRITVLKDGQFIGTVTSQESDQNQLIKMMVGRTLGEIFPTRDPPGAEVALEVRNLSKEGNFSDISFSIRRGEILGMFGLVGSGRTQVARCIFGAEPLTEGEILLNGKSIDPRSPREAVLEGIALLTEDRKRDGLVMSCNIRDNASMASYPTLSSWGVINRRNQATQVQQKVQELDVRPALLDRIASHLSGGNQQKLVLAKWLITQASVLVLDEPTRGVDVATKVEIYQIINNLARDGLGILLISSELPEILGMSDRTLVMREGRLVGEFPRAKSSEEILLAAAAGVSQ